MAAGGRMTASFVAGFDSYTENYSVVDKDTLDQLNEFRTRIRLGYVQGVFSRDFFQVEGQSLIGGESFETTGSLRVIRRFGASRLSLNGEVTSRSYHENSSYTFANDFLRYGIRAYAQRQIAPDLLLRLSDRLEIVDFEERTEFDYDYVRNGIQLAATKENGFTSSYHATVGFTNKAIPDSSEIRYKAYEVGFEYRHSFDWRKQVFVTVNGERRIYAHKPTKSPFWSIYSNASIQPFTRGSFGLNFDNELESYLYDETTDVYFDYVENRSALQVSYFRSPNISVGIGPAYGFLATGVSNADEYTEIGGKLSFDYSSGRVWLSASYEPGVRDYKIEEDDTTELIFSDFTYHRILLFTTIRLWQNASINVFLNLEPEDHKRKEDDSTTTLFSSDLTYSF